MQKHLYVLVHLIGWSFSIPVEAAEVQRAGEQMTVHGRHNAIQLVGEIKIGDTERLREVFESEYDDAGVVNGPHLLTLDSPGGSLQEAIELARYVRSRAITTHIGNDRECLSGCAMIFMAGTYAAEGVIWPRRILSRGAVLGFHAPFAGISPDNIAPDVALLLLEDVDRQASRNAVAIMDLVVEDILPASLARDLMMHDKSSFRYIDKLYDVGRWGIDLAGSEQIGVAGDLVQQSHRALQKQFCINMKNWTLDLSFEERVLNPADASFSGWALNELCNTRVSSEQLTFEYRNETVRLDGPVLYWKSLDPSLLLNDLTDADLLPPIAFLSPFDPRNEPPSQVDGVCMAGYQWIGGWYGFSWQDGIAHATYRSCDTNGVTTQPLVFHCKHGEENLEVTISSPALAALDLSQPSPILIDGEKQGHAFGQKVTQNGLLSYVFSLGRDIPLIGPIKSGEVLALELDGQQMSVHLSGAGEALEAMEASCL